MIGIVGGGVTGLALGWHLLRGGAEVVVLEAAAHAGGVVRSRETEGRVLELGPQRTRLSPVVARLVDALDLEADVVRARPGLDLFVFRAGRLRKVPFSVGDLLRSDVVGARAKVRLLLEPLTRAPDPGERVADLFRRKVGDELYEAVLGPLYGGLYASDPAEMEVGVALGRALEELGVRRSLLMALLRRRGKSMPTACSFRAGMQTLPDRMARELGSRLRLSTPVTRLERRGVGWTLDTGAGSVDVSEVVVTTPAGVTAGLLRPLDAALASRLAALRYNPLALVHLEADTPLEGLGFQMAFTELDSLLRGVTFNDSLFGRHRIYTAFMGGAAHPRIVEMPDDAVAETAADEFRRCTGYAARALSVSRTWMPAWDLSWRGLSGCRFPDGVRVAANWWSRPGLPGRLAEAERIASALLRPALRTA